MPFEEPTVLATFDRSFGDKKERLQLERGEYNGKPTHTLRLYWQTPDGAWRWCSQKPTQSGKCWERLNLKSKELRALGEALIAASEDVPADKPSGRYETPAAKSSRSDFRHSEPSPLSDDIPF